MLEEFPFADTIGVVLPLLALYALVVDHRF